MAKNNEKQGGRSTNPATVKLIISEACDLGNMITKHMATRSRDAQAHSMTIILYAVELLVHKSAELNHVSFDMLHDDLKPFLELIHEDIKRLTLGDDPKPKAS